MRRLVLLSVAGALWLFVAAIPALADGGPHVMSDNNGSLGINADGCAGCHRVHTAQGPLLLRVDSETNLCLSCHGAAVAGATTDVMTGVQYRLTGSAPFLRNGTESSPGVWTGTQLGALRGGGFDEARIDSSAAYRATVALPAEPAHPTVYGNYKHVGVLGAPEPVTSAHLGMTANGLTMQGVAWGNGEFSSLVPNAGPAVTLSCASCHNPHGNGLYRILRPLPDPATGAIVAVSPYATATNVADAPLPAPGDVRNYSVIQVSGLLYASQVVQAATLGYVPATTPVAIATIALDGTITTSAAHNLSVGDAVTISGSTSTPDINGTQTILSIAAPSTASPTTFKLVGVTITVAGSGGTVSRNAITGEFGPLGGDYWHQVVPYNSTVSDSINTNHDAPNGQPLTFNGQINAWCAVCHSRYTQSTNLTQENPVGSGTVVGSNGIPIPGSAEKPGNVRTRVCVLDVNDDCTYPNTLQPMNQGTGDAIYDYRHTTSRNRACTTCHVSHGSNATMDGTSSSTFPYPDGDLSASSRLLKVDNRGTCQLCHDPTITSLVGDVSPVGAPAPLLP